MTQLSLQTAALTSCFAIANAVVGKAVGPHGLWGIMVSLKVQYTRRND